MKNNKITVLGNIQTGNITYFTNPKHIKFRPSIRMNDDLDILKTSIKQIGLKNPLTIEIDSKGEICLNHGLRRLLALIDEGCKNVKVEIEII